MPEAQDAAGARSPFTGLPLIGLTLRTDADPPLPEGLASVVAGRTVSLMPAPDDGSPVKWWLFVGRDAERASPPALCIPGWGALVLAPPEGETWPTRHMVALMRATLRAGASIALVYETWEHALVAKAALDAAASRGRTVLGM